MSKIINVELINGHYHVKYDNDNVKLYKVDNIPKTVKTFLENINYAKNLEKVNDTLDTNVIESTINESSNKLVYTDKSMTIDNDVIIGYNEHLYTKYVIKSALNNVDIKNLSSFKPSLFSLITFDKMVSNDITVYNNVSFKLSDMSIMEKVRDNFYILSTKQHDIVTLDKTIDSINNSKSIMFKLLKYIELSNKTKKTFTYKSDKLKTYHFEYVNNIIKSDNTISIDNTIDRYAKSIESSKQNTDKKQSFNDLKLNFYNAYHNYINVINDLNSSITDIKKAESIYTDSIDNLCLVFVLSVLKKLANIQTSYTTTKNNKTEIITCTRLKRDTNNYVIHKLKNDMLNAYNANKRLIKAVNAYIYNNKLEKIVIDDNNYYDVGIISELFKQSTCSDGIDLLQTAKLKLLECINNNYVDMSTNNFLDTIYSYNDINKKVWYDISTNTDIKNVIADNYFYHVEYNSGRKKSFSKTDKIPKSILTFLDYQKALKDNTINTDKNIYLIKKDTCIATEIFKAVRNDIQNEKAIIANNSYVYIKDVTTFTDNDDNTSSFETYKRLDKYNKALISGIDGKNTESIEINERVTTFINSINNLSDNYKKVFKQVCKGYGYKAIAKKLNMNVNTVKSTIRELRKKILKNPYLDDKIKYLTYNKSIRDINFNIFTLKNDRTTKRDKILNYLTVKQLRANTNKYKLNKSIKYRHKYTIKVKHVIHSLIKDRLKDYNNIKALKADLDNYKNDIINFYDNGVIGRTKSEITRIKTIKKSLDNRLKTYKKYHSKNYKRHINKFKLIKSTKHVYKIRTIDTDTLIKNIYWCKNQISLLKKDIKSYINTYNLLTNNHIDTITYSDNSTLDNCNYIISIAHNKYYNYKTIGHKAVNNRYVFNINKQFNNNTDISISYDTDIINNTVYTYHTTKHDNRTKTNDSLINYNNWSDTDILLYARYAVFNKNPYYHNYHTSITK